METPRLLWTPDEHFKRSSNLGKYMQWLGASGYPLFNDYHELWTWSVAQPDDFWKSIVSYFDIRYDGSDDPVLKGAMPRVKWFENMRLNYTEHIFRKSSARQPAIIFKSENGDIQELSWRELEARVGSLQLFLQEKGVMSADRVAAYLPCIPEATVAMLATTGLGAIWSSASPDFGTQAVVDRFTQIEPKVLIAVDNYAYGGKRYDKSDVIDTLLRSLPSVQIAIIISNTPLAHSAKAVFQWHDVTAMTNAQPVFVRVPFSHPLWVLYSSGTTGLPKPITHGHGGILLEQLKYTTFHNDFSPGERCFWYTTTGWMMWNYIHGSLLCGATMVLYDGSPAFPDLSVLWEFAHQAGIHHFGTSAAFILANMKADISPAKKYPLPALRSIGSTGSTLPPEGFDFIYEHVKKDVWLASMSGGTDVCSAFVGGNPLLPVYAGEIQCRALGCRLEAFDEEGHAVTGKVGEMVITQPMPSMPVFFWNDPEFQRYHESYFESYSGVWRHGDWTEITPRNGVVI
ncbi:MAG TPA: acetoacetate--CoA ligase, partial [Chryseosolibacter sp.]|nr:acetoacetate--CoA ligase [Chryseosolibacter sp.]